MTIFKANLFNTPPLKYAGFTRTPTHIDDGQMQIWDMRLRMMVMESQCQSKSSKQFASDILDLIGMVHRTQ